MKDILCERVIVLIGDVSRNLLICVINFGRDCWRVKWLGVKWLECEMTQACEMTHGHNLSSSKGPPRWPMPLYMQDNPGSQFYSRNVIVEP